MATTFKAVEHQLAEEIRNNNKSVPDPEEPSIVEGEPSQEESQLGEEENCKPDDKTVIQQTVVNQYGDHPVHIDYVKKLKL